MTLRPCLLCGLGGADADRLVVSGHADAGETDLPGQCRGADAVGADTDRQDAHGADGGVPGRVEEQQRAVHWRGTEARLDGSPAPARRGAL